MKVRSTHHFVLLAVTAAVTVVCGILMPRVNVNSDMTKYLPDSSRMKEGLDILANEFGSTEINGADVRVMFSGLPDSLRAATAKELEAFPEVDAVSYKADEIDGTHTLYDVSVPKSVDQKRLGQEISEHFGDNVIVETSQDGATPPISVLIIAGSLILLILLLMSESWMEPLLFMVSTGMAVVINIGTNAFLSSVSITTNYIVAILQLVLSLDYAIILMSRYRQEKNNGASPLEAINMAIPKAVPSIVSSALTTVVGLLMLIFMKLKIGMDMGIVLAKGVVCSLICDLSALPALILLCNKAIEKSAKRSFAIPTDALARFSTRHRVTLVIVFLTVFFGSYFLHNRTEISFSTNGESKIDKVFPRKNIVVTLYDNEEESKIIELADSISTIDGVESVISYPTLLLKEYTAENMISAVKSMSEEMGAGAIPPEAEELLSPQMLRIVYYMKYNEGKESRIGFPELTDFISRNCIDNPLFSAYIDDDMRAKMDILASFQTPVQEEEEAEEKPATVQPGTATAATTTTVVKEEPKQEAKAEESAPAYVPPVIKSVHDGYSIINFVKKLSPRASEENVRVLLTLVDTSNTRKKMTAQEISRYVGSTPSQTKMVFSFAKEKSKMMSPLEYVHFLSDDLFHRKALASMVSASQKQGLLQRMRFMDCANANAKLSAAELARMVTEFGVDGIDEEKVKSLMDGNTTIAKTEQPPVQEQTQVSETPAAQDSPAQAASDSSSVSNAASAPEAAPAPKPAPKPKKTLEEIRQELFMDLMYSGKEYTAAQMTRNFKRLGEDIAPELVEMLYTYYGSMNDYDESWTMTTEGLVNYISDSVMSSDKFSMVIDDKMRSTFEEMSSKMEGGKDQLRGDKHSLAVIVSGFPDESAATYSFMDSLNAFCDNSLDKDYYNVGESVMFSEMKSGFSREMLIVTLLTILAIFLIVAITFRSIIVPLLLVMTVLSGVFVNVFISGIGGGTMLYLAYLIVQSILMGATIDYGILFANYYREKRATMEIPDAVREAYRGSIHTIMTSGLIMTVAPGVMSLLVDDVAISAIVGCLSVGAIAAVFLILTVVPGLLAAFDKLVVRRK